MSNQSSILLLILKKYLLWICTWKLVWVVSVWAPFDNPTAGFSVMEIWKDISGYERFYQISNLGNVKSVTRMTSSSSIRGGNRFVVGKKLKTIVDTKGYMKVTLSKYSKTEQHLIHRLIALAFIPNPENKCCVNHIDGNKLNNNIDNLEWCTAKENIQHAHRTGLVNYVVGEDHYCAKLNEFQVRVIRKTKGLTQQELADIFKISQRSIYLIINNETWKHI